MTKMLANLKIGKKLALLLGSAIAELVLLGGISFWALSSIAGALADMKHETTQMLTVERAASAITRAATLVGQAIVSPRWTAEDQARIVDARKMYTSALGFLKEHDDTAEGKRLLTRIEETAKEWREINVRALELKERGRRADATTLYTTEGLPHFAALDNVLREYMEWEQQQVNKANQTEEAVTTRMKLAIPLVALLSVLAAAFFGTVVTRGIAKPLSATVEHIDAVAKGDVSKDVSEEYAQRADEFGEMTRAVRTMSVNLREVLKEIAGGIHVLSSSSAELSASSTQMSAGARHASERAHSVAAAAEQMSANAVSVAAGMDSTSSNLSLVTTSTEQMTATIGEIAGNSEKARRITGEATRQATRITEQMHQLGEAAREIGKVTETITEISSQTNLLALNATIEAARAGAAGKGFAVVANEIKELAQQTAAATEDIKARIAGVQSSASSGISEIDRISQVIHDVSDIVTSIATAIEEQAAVTKDISRSIGNASSGVVDANARVSQTSEASQEIAREIVGVNKAASEMADGSDQVMASATELSRVAEQLKGTVARFRV